MMYRYVNRRSAGEGGSASRKGRLAKPTTLPPEGLWAEEIPAIAWHGDVSPYASRPIP